MSKKFDNIDQVINELSDYFEGSEFKTNENVVDAIVELGNTDKVYAFDDDHLGLKDDLSRKFLEASTEHAGNVEFEPQLDKLLEQAENTIGLAERELSEEQKEDVREEFISRGLDPDDADI